MDHQQLKILYLARWYPHRYDPMPGLFIERHARSAAACCRVAVLYVHPDDKLIHKPYETEMTSDEEILQVKIYFRPFRRRIPMIQPLANLLRFCRMHFKGYRMVRKEMGKPDVIHVNVLTRIGAIALMIKVFTGIPYVITEHWTRYLPMMDNFKGGFRKFVTRIVVKNASAVMPVTVNLQRAMEGHGLTNDRYVIIPNVVDTDVFRPLESNVIPGKHRFVHVSCFEDRQKNISGILRVLKKLSEQRQDWECHMIGDGIHYELLLRQAEELGLKNRFVIFHGLKENQDLVALMQEAEFQLMFSRFENLPVVILESYACGVPVLSTDVGGIGEHLDENLGILIPSEDEDVLFDKLNTMLDSSGKYERSKIRQYAMDHFSKEVIGRQLCEVYRSVAKKRSPLPDKTRDT